MPRRPSQLSLLAAVLIPRSSVVPPPVGAPALSAVLMLLAAQNWSARPGYAGTWAPWAAFGAGLACGCLAVTRIVTAPVGAGRPTPYAARVAFGAAFAALVVAVLVSMLVSTDRIPRPLGLVLLVCMVPFPLMALRLHWRRLTVLKWLSEGRCGACGYDLTGNTSGRCSECGEAVIADGGAAA